MKKWMLCLFGCAMAFLATLLVSWVEYPAIMYTYAEQGLWALVVSFWHYLVLFSPVFAAIGVGFCLTRLVGALDELQQRIQLEALAFSLANTVLAALALGLLLRYEPLNLACVLPIAGVFYGVGLWMARRRYR